MRRRRRRCWRKSRSRTPQGLKLLRRRAETMRCRAGLHRVLRVARTLADLDGAGKIGRLHLAKPCPTGRSPKTSGAPPDIYRWACEPPRSGFGFLIPHYPVSSQRVIAFGLVRASLSVIRCNDDDATAEASRGGPRCDEQG